MLNKRHAELAPRIDAALRTMKAEGLIERAYRNELRRVGIWELPDD